jgi:hypothetical protein
MFIGATRRGRARRQRLILVALLRRAVHAPNLPALAIAMDVRLEVVRIHGRATRENNGCAGRRVPNIRSQRTFTALLNGRFAIVN